METNFSYEQVDTVARNFVVPINLTTKLPVPGLNAGNFTIRLVNPSRVEVSGSITVTVTEIGSTGLYEFKFTPNAVGMWVLEVEHATYFTYGKRAVYLVREYLLGADSTSLWTDFMFVHDASNDGVASILPSAFTKKLYNPSLAEVSGALPVTITEVALGLYQYSHDRNAEGKWLCAITHPTHFVYGQYQDSRYHLASIVDPVAPALTSVTDDETGNSATAAIVANDERNTMYVRYKLSSSTGWLLFGATRTGSGDLQITGLSQATYDFEALERSSLTGKWSVSSEMRQQPVTTGVSLVASGPISTPLELVRTLLANSATFQTQVGAANPTAAKAYIFIEAVRAASATANRAIVSHLSLDKNSVGSGASYDYSNDGDVEASLEFVIPDAYKTQDGNLEEEAALWFGNKVGAIVEEMLVNAGSVGHLDAVGVTAGEMTRTSRKVESQATFLYRTTLRVTWGT